MVARRALGFMVLGTASNVGKSVLTAALCRYLAGRGVAVAPFKAQNMSLNSAVTPDGKEIGRAQAFQAEAAGIAPTADMNPILIKPTSDSGSQVVVRGERFGELHARDYRAKNRERFWPIVLESYERLAARYDAIVLEGAGSPAEINLRDGDIVNMAMAHAADARCMLVADIDRGGVFAAIFGTLALLDERDRARIDGFAINKFRGDRSLLEPGIRDLESRCARRCFGVLPYVRDLQLDEEDSLAPERRAPGAPWYNEARADDRLRIAVVAFPYLSNFTDFDELANEPSVDLRYTVRADDIENADLTILPGTKDTIADLRWLRQHSLDAAVLRCALRAHVLGICGGLQMLGRRISDPFGIESGGEHEALGLLPLETKMEQRKTTCAVTGRLSEDGTRFEGYEIHVGATQYARSLAPFAAIRRVGEERDTRDGARSENGRVAATYVHGLFADDDMRHAYLRALRIELGLPEHTQWRFSRRERCAALDRFTEIVAAELDLDTFFAPLLLHR
ncbi:MAG TPA: cobyric acid synthase [Candidatus Dormibacteraeota bacterium]|nr:cobyric acid synthase [Candidatus Dormibacteraeota bacterium]